MEDIFRLDGKIAVVVGGAGSIGGSMASGLAQYGARLAIASRNLERLQEVAKKIQADTGSEVATFQVDVNDEQSVLQLAEHVVSQFGTVDILVNAHGSGFPKEPADKFPLDGWNYLFDLNVRGVMFCCREFGKTMINNKKGKIINLSSVRGARATLWGGNLGYCATKGAVDMMTRALASEWAQYNITVNAIAPSLVATPEILAKRTPEQIQRYVGNVPLKRVADPTEAAGLCVFLASPASDFITGQIIYLDGGLTAIA
ncbi:MAG TPA: SDR family oxidoreductase [Desulfatiglandales bacterium]|nr:SDR family oxidoreductase [Desulfatiglandales bacterium]